MPRPRRAVSLEVIRILAGCVLTLGASSGHALDNRSAGAAASTSAPEVVSPGNAAGSRIGDACPTFSWAAVAGAEGYEVIVYLLGEETEEAKPVLLEAVSGSASSWTPSFDRCLERGGRHAWSVRALDGGKTSDWSPPSLFQVALEPTEAELERALEVVRLYAEGRDQVAVFDAAGVATEAVPSASSEKKAMATRTAPQLLTPAATQMSVDGNVDAGSFSGSGFLLTDLNPDPPCFSADRRFLDCGNGTITDGATGLIYLKNTSCFPAQPYVAANALAALTKDGVCGLTDGSHRGDWRLPTLEDWQTILDDSCATAPKLVGNGTPVPGCFADNGGADAWITVDSPLGDYWSSTTFFLYDKANTANFSLGIVELHVSVKTNDKPLWMVRGGS